MVAITRKIGDLTKPLRQALEDAVGSALGDEQQVVIQVNDAAPVPLPPSTTGSEASSLPDWCQVYDGLSEDELASIDSVIVNRAKLGRAVP